MTAIIWRDMKVSMGSVFGLVLQFSTPVFMLLIFATAFSSNIGKIATSGTDISYIEFFAPGLFGYMTFFLLNLSFSFLRIDKHSGVLSIIALSRASLASYFWGKYFVQLVLTLLKIVLIAVIAMMLTKNIPDISLLNAVLFMITLVLGVAIWYSLGMLGGIFIQRDDLREVVLMMLILPLTFASSMYYNIQMAPTPIRWLATFNPLTYICNIFRGCYLNNLPYDSAFQVGILAGCAALMVTAALLSLKKVRF